MAKDGNDIVSERLAELVKRNGNAARIELPTNGNAGKNGVNGLAHESWPADLVAYAIEGDEPWAGGRNAEIWHWRNQADGFYE